jgi:1A family penicillin-binding protein
VEAPRNPLIRLLALLGAGGVALALTLVLLAPAVSAVVTAHESAGAQDIDLDALAQRSVVLDAHGGKITDLYREINRVEVAFEDVPQVVIDTVLTVEDAGFYEHEGIDVQAIARAFLTNVESGDLRQGGSTITQQLVKNALLTPEQNIERKVREAVLALQLEDTMSKEEILGRYLNTVYLGNGTYGLQAAAELYFGVDAAELDQAQAAFLAGLIRNPVGYDPFTKPEESKARRDLVVDLLLDEGQVDAAEAEAIKASPVPSEPFDIAPKRQDYFIQEIIQRLLDDERLGDTQSERYNALFAGGLTIKTTLDPFMQWSAAVGVATTLPDTGGKFTAAVVGVEPGTGAVRAMVGGPGFDSAKYNIATQGIGRQAGSSFKPYVLAAALEEGISPKSTINGSAPCKLPNEGGTPNPWEVDNYEGSRGGTMDLYTATAKSMNCAYARLALIVGLDDVAAMAAKLGITSPLPEVPSMALGSLEVRPIDQAAAYATFANDGVYAEPYFVDEILDRDGNVIFEHEPVTRRVISADTARTVNEMLGRAVASGTGTRARFADRRPMAGKTGTTSNYADAWFVGYTPELSTAVWMGSPVGTEDKMTNVGGIRVTGGSYPARIWQAFMGPLFDGRPHTDFPDAPEPDKGEYLHIEGEPDRPRPRPRPRATTTTVAPEDGDGDGGGGDGGGGGGGDGDSGGGGGNGNGNGRDGDVVDTAETGQTAPSG